MCYKCNYKRNCGQAHSDYDRRREDITREYSMEVSDIQRQYHSSLLAARQRHRTAIETNHEMLTRDLMEESRKLIISRILIAYNRYKMLERKFNDEYSPGFLATIGEHALSELRLYHLVQRARNRFYDMLHEYREAFGYEYTLEEIYE